MRVRRLGFRERPDLFDAGVAGLVTVFGQVEVWTNGAIQPKATAAACQAALGLALAFRRRFPLLVAVVVFAVATGEAAWGVPLEEPLTPMIASVIAVYTLVTNAPLDRAVAGSSVAIAAVGVQTVVQHKGLGNFLFPLVFLAVAWLAGRTLHARTAQALRLENEQEQRAAAAVEEERRRIARELHDIIAHSLGVLVLQAGAAEQVLDRDPERAREVLQTIRTTGQEAIGEMTTLLALVRGEQAMSLEPLPSLADLERLVASTRDAGLAVRLKVEGVRRELPAPLELSIYRIVQEGLTNALKHARGHEAQVTLRYGQAAVEVEVTDDGAGGANGRGSRRGLAGIGERVAIFGGQLQAGPEPQGGWTLRATLPVPR